MKLNLGCGKDQRVGYVNVDFVQPCDQLVDLSSVPWPWADGATEEILMLDFLEHFPYRATEKILQECWRILQPGGKLVVQVPDFEHCAWAAMRTTFGDNSYYMCNSCGELLDGHEDKCKKCNQSLTVTQDAAIHRLYGGQNVKGNWHHTAFTKDVLRRHLQKNGFVGTEEVEHDHQYANWNFKLEAHKGELEWGDQ